MSRMADACPACGGRNRAETPWYAYALGAVLVLMIFLWLSDFAGLAEFVGRLVNPAP